MTQFHERSMKQRWARGGMDDEAMAVFADVWPNNWIRYGLDRAPIGTRNWPDKWRFTPDCADKDGLIEVQGFGQDRLLKIKDTKRAALDLWEEDCTETAATLRFFMWDRTTQRWAYTEWCVLDALLGSPYLVDTYHEGTPYRALHADQIAHLPWKLYVPKTRDPN
jgi:hypothetical protein